MTIDTSKISHIAVIMDGNRRWAKLNDIKIQDSYKKGLESLRTFIINCIEYKIKYITCYAFSTENWKQRSKQEIDYLTSLLEYYLSKESNFFISNQIKLNVIGDYSVFSDTISSNIKMLEEKTDNYTNITLNLALNYGGRAEITNAIKKISTDISNNKININSINEALINNYLYTNNIPDPNILIRTGGDKRLSNFLLWQLSYTELFFVNEMWPEFNKKNLDNIINEYNNRKINIGK